MKKHLLEAAERGDAEAQFNLGVIYENGLNDSRYAAEGNRPEAVRWLLAAAEQGLPRSNQTCRDIRRRARHARKLGQSVRVDPVGDRKLARRPSPKRSVRLPAGVHRFDAGRDRTSQVLCAELEAVPADRSHNVGSATKFRGRRTCSIASSFRFILMLIGLGLVKYVTLSGFH